MNLKIIQKNISNTKVSLTLSTNNKEIEFEIGDKPYSHTCDYMENCNYTCSPSTDMQKIKVKKTTFFNIK